MSVEKRPIPDCTFNDIMAVVLAEVRPAGVTWSDIQGRGRSRPVVFARRVMAYLAYTCTHMSYPEIAAAMSEAREFPKAHSIIHDQARITGEMVMRDDLAKWMPSGGGMTEVMADFRAMVRETVAKRQGVQVA